MSESEMLNYLAKYCSQAERCLYDVRKKLKSQDLSCKEEKRIIDHLLKEKFIDEKRFSRCFVHDKFKFNHWGRIKICYELKLRGIPPEAYQEAIETIDEDEYAAVLTELLIKQKRTVKGRSPQDIYQKLCRFASARGFEPGLITAILKKMFKNMDDD